MSTSFLELEDRIITDTGTMVAKYDLLVRMALSGERFDHLPFEAHHDINQYHRLKGTADQAKRWVSNDELIGPSLDTFEWMIPDEYKTLDIEEYCSEVLVKRNLDTDEYVDRLVKEFAYIEKSLMTPFIQCLIWMIDIFKQNDMVWGLGRGSSCASLVMFLLDVNKVDPVKYDIPMEEFYK